MHTGSYRIIRVIDSQNLVIQKSSKSKVVHRDKLKHVKLWDDEASLTGGGDIRVIDERRLPIDMERPIDMEAGDNSRSREPTSRIDYVDQGATRSEHESRPKRTIRRPARFNDFE